MSMISPASAMTKAKAFIKGLPASILNGDAKDLVLSDPDLGKETMRSLEEFCPALQAARPIEFSWYIDDVPIGISTALLSMCINEDKQASLAEVVGRYADARSIPFVLAAREIVQFKQRNGSLFRYDGEATQVRWYPVRCGYGQSILPPKKRLVG